MVKLAWIRYFENLIDGVCLVDTKGHIQWSNLSLSHLTGISEKRLIGTELLKSIHMSESDQKKILDLKMLKGETPYFRFLTNRKEMSQELGISFIPTEDADQILVVIRDFSLEKQLHEKYRMAMNQKEELYKHHQRKLFQSLFLMTLSETANKVREPIEILNRFLPQMNEFFGYAAVATFIEQNGELVATSHSMSDSLTESQMEVLEMQLEIEIDDSFHNKTTKILKVEEKFNIALVPFFLGDKSLGVTFCVKEVDREIHRDEIQMLQAIGQQTAFCMESTSLREATNSDDLTKVFNSRYFHKILGELTLDPHGPSVALIFVDVDYFKKVNDNYGHPAGDEILRRVAQSLKEGLRSSEVVCRYGGEEFGVILPNCNKDDAFHVAERLRKAIMNLRFPEINTNLRITVSMGVAAFPNEAKTKEGLIEAADQALYEAKRSGRNRVIQFHKVKAA